jgi:hypothetical protein
VDSTKRFIYEYPHPREDVSRKKMLLGSLTSPRSCPEAIAAAEKATTAIANICLMWHAPLRRNIFIRMASVNRVDGLCRSLAKNRVGVEKVHFLQNSPNLGDGKCLGEPRKSFVGLPIAKFFRAFSGERVFQQRRARPVVGAKRKGTCLGRAISAS